MMVELQRRYALLIQNVVYFQERMEVLFSHVVKHRFVFKLSKLDICDLLSKWCFYLLCCVIGVSCGYTW